MLEIKDRKILINPHPHGITNCGRCGIRLDGINGGTIEYTHGWGSNYITKYFLCGVCHSECQKVIDAFVTKSLKKDKADIICYNCGEKIDHAPYVFCGYIYCTNCFMKKYEEYIRDNEK